MTPHILIRVNAPERLELMEADEEMALRPCLKLNEGCVKENKEFIKIVLLSKAENRGTFKSVHEG